MMELRALVPHMTMVVLGVLVIALDLLPIRRRPCCLGALTALGAMAVLYLDWMAPPTVLWNGLAVTDGFAKAFDSVFLVSLAVVSIGAAGWKRHADHEGEAFGVLVFATLGLMLASSAKSLLMLYVGIELTTICLMGLVGFNKSEKRSAEAAVKLFVVGAVASALTLYGAGVIYGVTGSTEYDRIVTALGVGGTGFPWALWLGVACVVAGVGFKVSAAPFHLWAPDVYEGSPTPITAFLSTASKAGGFAALIRFLLVALENSTDRWLPVILLLALASMTVGNLVAIVQTNFKRLLAYSGIAQAGYMLVALAGAASAPDLAISSIVMYAFLYAFTNIGGFMLAQAIGDTVGSDDISALRGLHRRSPILAFATLVVLFSLGGIPPLAGFVGKLYLFAAGWDGGQKWLVGVGAGLSVIALYYYLRVALVAYILDPITDTPLRIGRPVVVALAVCVIGTIAIGVYPRPWIEVGERASRAIEDGRRVVRHP